MKRFDLIIFDLDGTLVDTAPDVYLSINLALAQMQLPAISEAQAKSAIGPGPEHFARIVLGENNTERLASFYELFRPIYYEKCVDSSRPFSGIPELLAQLDGHKMAVASNKRLSFNQRILKELELASYFELVVDPEVVGKSKPAPEMIEYVLKHFGVPAERALMVGDTDNDLLAARAAGVKSCGIGWGYAPLQELLSLNPDYHIERPLELLGIVGQNGRLTRQQPH